MISCGAVVAEIVAAVGEDALCICKVSGSRLRVLCAAFHVHWQPLVATVHVRCGFFLLPDAHGWVLKVFSGL